MRQGYLWVAVTSCVTLNVLFSLPELHFLICEVGETKPGVWRLEGGNANGDARGGLGTRGCCPSPSSVP